MAENPYTPRRTDRAVEDDEWIRDYLRESPSGVLATVSDGQPFLTPLIFVYDPDEHAIFVHTAATGRTRLNVDGEERVCFNVNEIGRILPAEIPLEFSNEYESVTVFGRARVLDDVGRQRRALQLLLDKYAPHLEPGEDYRPITDGEIERTAVYRIDVEEWSGKRKEAEPDFPGAYLYEELRTGEADGETHTGVDGDR